MSYKEEWHDKEFDSKEVVESNIVLRLSEKYDYALEIISEKLGYPSINEYVTEVVKQNIHSQMLCAMDLDLEQIAEVNERVLAGRREGEGD